MSNDISEGLSQFFEYVWQSTEGYVYLPTINKGQQLTKYMYQWPRQKSAVVKHVMAQDALGNDVFYAPAMFAGPRPEKENVLGTHIFWADLDGNAPTSWEEVCKKNNIPEPSMIIASSVEGREHAYWRLAGFESNIGQIDGRNRALALTLKADMSGWDANQFLRPPFTTNKGFNNKGLHKDWYAGVPIDVRLVRCDDNRVNPNIFNPLGTPEDIISKRIVLGEIPSLASVFMDGQWPEDFRTLFNYNKEDAGKSSADGRSGSLQRLGYFGAENGFSDEQIYAIVIDADDRWEKYTGRKNRDNYILDIIAKARAKHGYINAGELTFAGLIKDSGTNPVITDAKLVYSFQELSELEVHVDWLLEDLLRNEGIGIVTGPPGVGKTQFCIQLGAHMALGRELLGWNNATTPKKVVVFSLEMGVVPLKIFWNKIEKQYVDDVFELHKNFHVLPLGEGINLDKPEPQKFFEKILTEYQPDLVIIDSLQKITSKELTDELSVKAMLEFLDRMRIKHHTAMVFIHHNRKKGNDSNAAAVPSLDDMYGSRYIAANVDFVLNLRSLIKDIVTVDSVKNRLGEQRYSFEISRNENLQYEIGTDSTVMEGLIGGGSTGTHAGTGSLRSRAQGMFAMD